VILSSHFLNESDIVACGLNDFAASGTPEQQPRQKKPIGYAYVLPDSRRPDCRSAYSRDPINSHPPELLPLGEAHMMSFQRIPIGPLNPLRAHTGMQAKR
jgi:hypothetical protein